MDLTKNQAKKVALVTGGARRIGAAIVQHLHHHGYDVCIHYRHSQQEAEALALACNQIRPDSAKLVNAELASPQAGTAIIEQLGSWRSALHLLVNNASEFRRDETLTLDRTLRDRLFTVNVETPMALSLAAKPFLEKNQGCIINITDIHALAPLKDYEIYCQTKAALWMQTRALAKELAPSIRVNAVAPGAIAWPEQDNTLSSDLKKQIIEKTPLKKHGSPIFIAQAVLALAENPFITGQMLAVDGGRSIGYSQPL